MAGKEADALARLDVFVGEWVVEARFPGDQPAPLSAAGDGPARSWFEWALDRRFLLQRTEIPVPEAPDFTALHFRQRFTGTFSADGNTISGALDRGVNGGDWEHDFALTYHRAS